MLLLLFVKINKIVLNDNILFTFYYLIRYSNIVRLLVLILVLGISFIEIYD